MKTFHDLIVQRRSIRHFTAEPIAADDVKTILEAGLLAPTSKSTRSWQFIAVEDADMLTRLSECKESGASSVARCSLAIVVTADPEATDPWIEDASIAASYIQLQAEDLGLGSVWIQVRNRFRADGQSAEEYVREQLDMPERWPVLCIIAIGHKDEERKPANTDKLLWEKVHIGRWRNEE